MTVTRVTCLLVDDLEENLLALSALLRRDGLELLTARSGAEALELLLKHDVALAIVDVQMPEMDGFELAELMRGAERTRHVPIIFVTAAASEPSRAFRGYHAGAVDFLYKPIDPLILESKANVFFELYSQRLALAEELQRRSETLRLNEMFTAVLGHDLRNPLNAVLAGAFLLQHRCTEPEDRDAATRILNSGRRMARMIDNMLDLARARLGGGMALNRHPVDLTTVVDRVVEEHRLSHPERTIVVDTRGDVTGAWDGDRLQQVASNLIGNALQHGSRTGAVTVGLDGDSPGFVRLSVSNAGAIPAGSAASLFDPFRTGTVSNGQRLGLGLYIVQQIAQAHDGDVSFTSSEDQGTCFVVVLPR